MGIPKYNKQFYEKTRKNAQTVKFKHKLSNLRPKFVFLMIHGKQQKATKKHGDFPSIINSFVKI